MRVCVVTTGELFGGAERQNLTLMKALHGLGVCCELVVFFDAELANRARSLGFPVTVLTRRHALDRYCARQLERLLLERAPVAVSLHGYVGALHLATGRWRGPVVKTEHGFVESAFVPLRQRIKPRVYRAAENWAARRLRAHVVYVTQDLRSRCQREHAALVGHVIFNGIEPIDASGLPRPPEYDPGRMNLAIVGRIEPVKGVDLAIRALTSVRMPANAQLHVIGTGPIQPALEKLAVDLRVRDRVTFHGFRANSYDYIAHAEALLMPSRHEGLPYTALEAMALETPLIASRVGGLAEACRHESTALLVSPENPEELAAAIEKLHADHALGWRLRESARHDVQTRFSADTMARRYLEVLSEAGFDTTENTGTTKNAGSPAMGTRCSRGG